MLSEWRKVYAIIGIVSLALVIVIGSVLWSKAWFSGGRN